MLSLRMRILGGCYRTIIEEYGEVTKEELTEMIKLDEEVPEEYKEGDNLEKIIKFILLDSRQAKSERRIKLYEQRKTVKEIAEIEGCTYSAMLAWFKLRGVDVTSEISDVDAIREESKKLNKKKRGGKSTKEILDAEFLKLYKQGLTEKEIKEQLNVSLSIISEYRRNLGLPPNKKTPAGTGKKIKMDSYIVAQEEKRCKIIVNITNC